jgi:hypothetical protein
MIEFYEEELESIKLVFISIFGKETTENCYDAEGDIDFDKLKVAIEMHQGLKQQLTAC